MLASMDGLAQALLQRFGRERALVTADALLAYECDGFTIHKRRPRAVVLPETTAEVQELVRVQDLARLRGQLDRLHPADIAHILEALPPEERLVVWDLVKADRDGEILVEVSEAVRESLIATMDRSELVAAVETLEADELADIAGDLPPAVVEEVVRSLSSEEREQLRVDLAEVGELFAREWHQRQHLLGRSEVLLQVARDRAATIGLAK